MQAKDVSNQLALRCEEIAKRLFPEGKRIGLDWCVGDISGSHGSSLKILLSGARAGVWCDFATGESGDLLDLWARAKNLSIGQALKESCEYLGIKREIFAFQQSKQFSKPKIVDSGKLENRPVVLEYLIQERRLNHDTLQSFQISSVRNDIIFPYLREGEMVFVKYIAVFRDSKGKKVVRVEPNCEPSLFGWHLIPKSAREVTICEGEIDCMSLHQFGIPALSVPLGAGAGSKHEWIQYEFDRLAVFDKIYICMDNDEVGKIAAKELSERLGAHRCLIVELPMKDANECLQNGFDTELMKSYFREAKNLDPEELKNTEYFEDQTMKELFPVDGIIPGYESPWLKTRNKILFRPSELSVWSGINGHGKSQFLGHIMLGLMNQGAKICIASFEMKPPKLIARLTYQATAKGDPSMEYAKEFTKKYKENLLIVNIVGNAKSKRILEIFTYARQRYGVDVFIIDSLMKMDIAEDDYKEQKSFVETLCEFKDRFNCHIHLVVHPRKGADESTAPNKMDYKGTGAISDLADNCFSIWRNKAKEKAVEKENQGYALSQKELEALSKPDSLWFCDKQRHGDWEGSFAFWFDKPSFQYLETEGKKPKPFLEYSCLKS